MTPDQENLYNLYLSTSRKCQNKPYTIRKKFKKFKEDNPEKYASLLKLEKLFNVYAHFNKKLYIEAPYKIYQDKDHFDMKFYTTMGAVKCYNLYLNQLKEESPDSDSQLLFIKESLMFIKNFCIENEITINQYFKFRKNITLSWAIHIIEYKISFYVILGFKYFGKKVWDLLHDMPSDEKELLVGNIIENYKTYERRLDTSKRAKKLIIEGIKIIDKKVKKTLAN